MKIVADNNIPYLTEFFSDQAEITLCAGEKITASLLKDADALLVRTVTPVDKKLLMDTGVCFVGSVTTGTDHIDLEWLAQNQITFACSAGANANAVVDYVAACLQRLSKENKLVDKKVAGIIGYGRIGSRVAALCEQMGLKVLVYDPFLAENKTFSFASLDTLLSTADVISIHTPLTKTGSHPTFHLIDYPALQKIKSDSVLINTARGSVIDQSGLLTILNSKSLTLCLDVWENEPHLDLNLLNQVMIGTPHIAGYTAQAKYRATEMIYTAVAEHFGWHSKKTPAFTVSSQSSSYDPIAQTDVMRRAMAQCKTPAEIAKIFLAMRKIR